MHLISIYLKVRLTSGARILITITADLLDVLIPCLRKGNLLVAEICYAIYSILIARKIETQTASFV